MCALGGASLYKLPMICWIQGAPASQKAALNVHIKISDEEPVSPPKGIWISLNSLWRCDHERVTCIPPLFFSLPPFFSITPPFLCWKLVFARCLLFWRVAVDYTHSIRTELNKQLWDNWGGNEFSHRREEGADVSCMPALGPVSDPCSAPLQHHHAWRALQAHGRDANLDKCARGCHPAPHGRFSCQEDVRLFVC